MDEIPYLCLFQIMRDPDTGNSKGYAFINFASFDASDAAIEAMNGQYLCNRPISISYAFKKDSKGERHGSAAGRSLGYRYDNNYYHHVGQKLRKTPRCPAGYEYEVPYHSGNIEIVSYHQLYPTLKNIKMPIVYTSFIKTTVSLIYPN